ncbi:MAG: SRPBCC family protein [Thermoleophilaceae bacterium]|nr:SRPBCC family protein [Thermoleophilaceae bacterium]
MGQYDFTTRWLIDSDAEPVWDAIADFERWPSWWTSVQRVREVEPGAYAIAWRSRLPYELEFTMHVTRSERPRVIEGHTDGELRGGGVCTLSEPAGGTLVSYAWNVATTRGWMNALAPAARPVFVWNHDHVMRTGGEGIGRLLDTRVTS